MYGASQTDPGPSGAASSAGRRSDERFVAFLERCEIEGAILTIGGWAFRPGAILTEVAITFEGSTYADTVTATSRLARLDVGERLGPEAALSGFVATGLMIVEPGTLFIEMRSDDGRSHREPLGLFRPHAKTGAPEWTPAGALRDRLPAGAAHTLAPAATFTRLAGSRYAVRALRDFGGAPPPGPARRPVSILASLFGGPSFLTAFFAGLRQHTSGYDEIILVDNGNTDASLSTRIVAEASRIPRCRVLRVPVNEGYIKGIGVAFAAREVRGHVVVLNSDIELPAGWLPRLLWPLDNLPQVASATPFTNAGTSCSFPLTAVDNEAFLGLDVTTIDRAFQALDPRRMVVPLPSGVGFCMAMHAAAIEAVGWFDDKTFGLGYGEENDWCLRARTLGWRDVLVPNLFVYHKHGGVYPAETKRALLRRNLAIIDRLHPGYFGAVADYFRTDPTAAVRAIVAFRLGQQASGRPARVITVQIGADQGPVMASLAGGDPLIVVLFDEDRRTWSALLSAAGHRGQVWGWGPDELAALCARAEAAADARAEDLNRALALV